MRFPVFSDGGASCLIPQCKATSTCWLVAGLYACQVCLARPFDFRYGLANVSRKLLILTGYESTTQETSGPECRNLVPMPGARWEKQKPKPEDTAKRREPRRRGRQSVRGRIWPRVTHRGQSRKKRCDWPEFSTTSATRFGKMPRWGVSSRRRRAISGVPSRIRACEVLRSTNIYSTGGANVEASLHNHYALLRLKWLVTHPKRVLLVDKHPIQRLTML